MSTLQKVAAGLAGIYGLTSLTGGTIGYVKAGSLASLIAGGVAGVILLVSAMVALRKPMVGQLIALLVSLVLVGRFTKAAFGQQQISAIAAVMIGGGLAVLIANGLAVLRREQPRS
jgi:uncharacterized membrane protein (UPF0136 family)